MKLALLVVFTTLAMADPASAQRVSGARVGLAQPPTAPVVATMAMHRRASYWKTGAIVGAVLGLGLVALSVGAAGDGGSTSAGEVFVLGSMGILLGGVPGALIGGLFPK